jgi:hypothetical protein
MKLDGYENRFVVFLDILGFKKFVSNIENDTKDSENTFDRLKFILNYLHDESIESNTHHDLLIYEQVDNQLIEKELGDPKISYISDCLIMSTEGTFEGFKALCNKITKFSTDAASVGIFMRGAVTYGNLYHHGAILFGSAYQNAYELESTKAIYPRVIIDDIIFEMFKDKKNIFPLKQPTITTDSDGLKYLSNFPFQYISRHTTSWLDSLLIIKTYILYQLNLFDIRVSGFNTELKQLDIRCCWKEKYGYNLNFDGGNDSVLKKYIWIKNEFNKTISLYNNDLSIDGKLRISKIFWNETIWCPEVSLGQYR